MRRHLVNAAAVISLAIGLAMAVLWPVSYAHPIVAELPIPGAAVLLVSDQGSVGLLQVRPKDLWAWRVGFENRVRGARDAFTYRRFAGFGWAGRALGYPPIRGPIFPLWFSVAVFAAGPLLYLSKRLRRRLRTPTACPACGYDLRGTPSGPCPECGAAREAKAT